MTAPITPAQEKVLRELAKPGAKAEDKFRATKGRVYRWVWHVNGRRLQTTVNKLISKGLLTLEGKIFTATISEAGRDYLAALDNK